MRPRKLDHRWLVLDVRTGQARTERRLRRGFDMSSGNHLSHLNGVTQAQTPHHWRRREFVKGIAALAAAEGLSAYDTRPANAEPPPETRTIRLKEERFPSEAPVLVAQELLREEGFSDVQYVPGGN